LPSVSGWVRANQSRFRSKQQGGLEPDAGQAGRGDVAGAADDGVAQPPALPGGGGGAGHDPGAGLGHGLEVGVGLGHGDVALAQGEADDLFGRGHLAGQLDRGPDRVAGRRGRWVGDRRGGGQECGHQGHQQGQGDETGTAHSDLPDAGARPEGA
jgi:hypothetical protein